MRPTPLLLLATIVTLAIAPLPTLAAGEHDRTFWQSIVDNGFEVPEGEDAFALVLELAGYLGSPDPELRDDFGYTIPAIWIYREQKFDAAQLRQLTDLLKDNLRKGIGKTGDPSVLLRSFSALDLSILAAANNREPFLDDKGFAALVDATLAYLTDEKDVRGYIVGPGWHHSAAHTADILKFLGRNEMLTAEQQGRIMDAIRDKLNTNPVFTFGEDERLAHALRSLARRDDFERARFGAWVESFAEAAQQVWRDKPLDPDAFAHVQNHKNLFKSLLVLVSSEEPTGSEQAVHNTLRDTLRRL